jgi:hypothetical protein
MHKYSFTFLLVVLITLTGKSQNLDLIKSSLNHFQKEFHHKSKSFSKWNPANLRIAQNSGKKLDSLVQEKWNDDLQDWEYLATGYFYYDQHGKPSILISKEFDRESKLIEISKVDFIIDEIENKFTLTFKFKLPESEEWINNGKDEYLYDQSGRLKEKIDYYWSDETLQYTEKERNEYSYNEKGQLVREVKYFRGTYDYWYISENNYEYLYGSNGEVIRKNYLYNLPETDDLFITAYTDYVKINSYQSEEKWYYKNGENPWKQGSIRKLNYDANGNLVSDSTFSYLKNGLELVNPEFVNLEMYEYDLSVDVSEVNLFFDKLWNPSQLASMVNQPTIAIGAFFTDEFSSYYKNSYYFSESTITNTENSSSETINIYPNPAREILNIDGIADGQEVSILGIDGTHISSSKILNGNISTKSLQPGMYILDLGSQKLKFTVSR